jgi:hypothetical protein
MELIMTVLLGIYSRDGVGGLLRHSESSLLFYWLLHLLRLLSASQYFAILQSLKIWIRRRVVSNSHWHLTF